MIVCNLSPQIGALHAARTGSALQLSIHVRPKTARQLRREHLQRARLARIELRRDARIQKMAEREEAERYKSLVNLIFCGRECLFLVRPGFNSSCHFEHCDTHRPHSPSFKREAHGLSEANERAAIQAQIEQFRTVVSQERRRTQLDEARKRQAAADERQRKAEEEAWRRQMHEAKTSAAVAGMNPPPMSARSAAAASAAAASLEVPPTPRTPRTPTGASSQSRALLVAQALAIAKEKERVRELEKAQKNETQSSAKVLDGCAIRFESVLPC